VELWIQPGESTKTESKECNKKVSTCELLERMIYLILQKEIIMSTNVLALARKIAKAVNVKYKTHLVICQTPFFRGTEEVTMKIIKDAFYTDEGYFEKQLFRSASSIYICLFMRDILDSLDGKERADADNPGYDEVFAKNTGDISIQYLKENYIGTDG
jgi:hypothetical protein